MPVLFIDGNDYGDVAHLSGTLTPFLPPCKYTNFSSVASGSIVAGQGIGNALNFGNNGFHQQTKTKILAGPGISFCLGANFFIQDFTVPAKPLCRYEAGGTTIVNPGGFDDGENLNTALYLQVRDDGTFDVCTGAGGTQNFPGTILWNSAGVYVVRSSVWFYVELFVDTASGTWLLAVDDVVLQTQTGVSIPIGIDRYSFQAFGFENQFVDHHYLTDGQRLGPCRVVGFPPIIGSTHQWNPLNPPNLSQISEFGNRSGLNTPDNEISYVEATMAGQLDYYGFAAPSCFGPVLALALNADGFQSMSSGGAVDFLIKITGNEYSGGFTGEFGGDWQIQQAITMLNPATNKVWTPGDIAGALFGFSFNGDGTLRLTQFFAEALVSLRSGPFDCGGGPFSYTS